jgi:hypothetical protein
VHPQKGAAHERKIMEGAVMKPVDELLSRYRSITLEEIQEWKKKNNTDPMYEYVAEKTGFGWTQSCILCVVYYKDEECVGCIYDGDRGCVDGESAETYNAICDAATPEELYTAIQNRIEYIESLIEKK